MINHVIQKAVVQHNGKMLLLKRSDSDVRRPLQWDLPGGLLDEGEEFYQGVCREVKEEAGLDLHAVHLIYSQAEVREWIDDRKQQHKTNNVWLYYAGSVSSGKVSLSYEHCDFVWVSIDDAIELLEYPRQVELLRYIKDNQLEL